MPANEKIQEYTLSVVSRYSEVKNKKLQVIRIKDGINFKKQSARLLLSPPEKEDFIRYLIKNKIIIDCRSKVQTLESNFGTKTELIAEEYTLKSFIPFLNYEHIFEEIEAYKDEKSYYNISIDRENIRKILETEGWYSLIIPSIYIKVDSMEKIWLATNLAVTVLRGYFDRFYNYKKEYWEAPFLEYRELDKDNNNFVKEYKFSYCGGTEDNATTDSIGQFVDNLQKLLNQHSSIPSYQIATLSNSLIAFDFRMHLYAPLVHLKTNELKLTISPVSLNNDEKKFVDILKAYIDNNTEMFSDKSLYLLRNKSKVGMGFFEAGNFYPDYILWIDTAETQYISFIDPKGLRHLQWNDPKIEFHTTIKELETRLQSSSANKRVVLNSFIMSGASPIDLYQWWGKNEVECYNKNVLFLDGSDCIEKMMQRILAKVL
jgi:hypothetical protein